MHVTHIVAHPPFREGTGTVAYYNARALQDLGCTVTVYAARRQINAALEQLNGYRFMPCWLAVGNAYLTPQILTIGRTDIVHLHYPFIFGSELTWLRTLSARVPLVITYHNDLLGGGLRRPAFWVYNRSLAPLVLRRARKIVVTSLDYAAASFYGPSIFAERQNDLVEVANGVATDAFRPEVEGAFVRLRHQLAPAEVVLLFVSSLDRSHKRKGLELLLNTLADMPARALKLLVVGDGDMRLDYEHRAKELGLAAQVIFAGRVSQSELPAYYAACDMVVIPSLPPEAFGMALAQGMAAGKPVIGSNIPGVRTVMPHGEVGFLITPTDKNDLAVRIESLAADPVLRQAMGQRGRQRVVEHYTWQRAGERLRGMYQKVLSS